MYVAAGIKDEAELRQLCELAYNNRLRVPEHGTVIDGWQRDAAAFRDQADCELALAYGARPRMALDLFWPHDSDRTTCPIVLFIHGGYWQALDRAFFSHLAGGANAHGVALAMPSYTLCPQATIGQIINEMAEACLFLWRRHGRRLTACGHSAGGHLTAALLSFDFAGKDKAAPTDLVTCGLPISGLFDLRDLRFTSINDKAGLSETDAQAWSPLLRLAPTGRQLESFVGANESEAFLWQSDQIATAWRKAGNLTRHVPTKRVDGRGDDHFSVVAHLADPASAMTARLVALARGGLA